jgi:hypothetical protein
MIYNTGMQRAYAKRFITLLTAIFIYASVAFSQFDNTDFLRAGEVDGMKLTEAYITPWANAFGAGVNGSWYNTAKPHKFGGFDITLGTNFGFVPSSALNYDVSKIGLTEFTGTGMAPTVAGPDKDGPTLTGPSVDGVAPITFQTPPGTDWKTMPVPTLTAGIGLPLGTELRIRYIPKISVSDANISSWGVGLLHSLIQYLPGEKLLPFDVSLFGGFTRLQSNVPLDMQPDPSKGQYYSSYSSDSFDNQNFGITVDAWNASLIGSFNLPVISFYGGLGYSSTRTNVKMTGNFPLPTINPEHSTTEYIYEDAGVLKDFPEMDIKNFSGLRTNVGFRLKFSVVTIHADYTWSQYSVVSTGLGISFR